MNDKSETFCEFEEETEKKHRLNHLTLSIIIFFFVSLRGSSQLCMEFKKLLIDFFLRKKKNSRLQSINQSLGR